MLHVAVKIIYIQRLIGHKVNVQKIKMSSTDLRVTANYYMPEEKKGLYGIYR